MTINDFAIQTSSIHVGPGISGECLRNPHRKDNQLHAGSSGQSGCAENFLLDVGVPLFDPGIDEFLGDDEDTANPEIRVAESRYAPYLLAETLQRSANWGIVRVMPNSESPMDVQVNGTILRSNGEAMIIRWKSTILVGVTGTPKSMKKSSASLAMTRNRPEERSVSGDLQ